MNWVEKMANEQWLKTQGTKLNRKYRMQISSLKPPTMNTYKDPKPVILGEGAESIEEMQEQEPNTEQNF